MKFTNTCQITEAIDELLIYDEKALLMKLYVVGQFILNNQQEFDLVDLDNNTIVVESELEFENSKTLIEFNGSKLEYNEEYGKFWM